MSDKKEIQSEAVESEQTVEISAEKGNKKSQQKAVEKNKAETNKTETTKTETTKTEKTEETSPAAAATKAEMPKENAPKTEAVVVKKGGSGLAFLALLVALGVGGAGYYFGQLEVDKINQKMTALEQKFSNAPALGTQTNSAETPNFEQERAALENLVAHLKNTDGKVSELEKGFAEKEQAYLALQTQLNKVAANSNAQPSDWLLNEADFLLTNALRKLLLDNDIETSISLLKVSDEVLSQVADPAVKTIRAALNQDLKQLLSLNSVDQNAIMQRLSQLANNIDELTVVNVNFGDEQKAEKAISDDVNDWQSNLEKSAKSFLNHFIRITPRSENATQALLAPNQDIYLRENIRLRLQIAILAVPRQQNELYKQSLETVAAWVRSYFDTSSENVANFLKSLDELAEQSIYIDVPNQLNSLNALDKLLNKTPQEVKKIELSADKALTEANQVAAQEIKEAEETKVAEETKAADEAKATEENKAVETAPAENAAPAESATPAEATPATQP
ncbi:HemX protein [Pasteurellaceae bacterium Pebbles2]|nr:HemX protein [Pasteurellaceae bacterium Pebbles2]